MRLQVPRVHQDEGKFSHQISAQGAEEELDPDRVGDDETEDVLVVLISEEGGGGQAGVVSLQPSVHGHARSPEPPGRDL